MAEWVIQKHVFSSDRKLKYLKLPWHKKDDSKPENFTSYMVNSFACDKNPPLIFESVLIYKNI